MAEGHAGGRDVTRNSLPQSASPTAPSQRGPRIRTSPPCKPSPAAKALLNGGPWPPPTFAAPRQRRDLIIANPRRVFPKREDRSPPSLVAQGWGIFKGEGRSKLPSPLNGVLWILSFAKERKYPAGGIPRRGAELPCLSGKKVTRRRQQRRKKEKERESRPQAALLPSIYITPPSRLGHSRRCCGDRPRRRCSSRCCGTRRTSAPADSSAKWPRRCSWV